MEVRREPDGGSRTEPDMGDLISRNMVDVSSETPISETWLSNEREERSWNRVSKRCGEGLATHRVSKRCGESPRDSKKDSNTTPKSLQNDSKMEVGREPEGSPGPRPGMGDRISLFLLDVSSETSISETCLST